MTFDDINDIRTVFWVIKEDSDATTKRRCVLGHSSQYDFWRGYDAADSDPFWDGTYTASEVVNGTLEVNGTSTNGLNTAPPTTASIVYLQTTGNVQADQLTKDRTFDSRVWDGDIAEIIIYSDTLTSTEQQQVIDYLSEKYDITVN